MWKSVAAAFLCLMSVIAPRGAIGKVLYTIGGNTHPWAKSGTSEFTDVSAGAIQPLRVSPEENLSLKALSRGGGISPIGATEPEVTIDGDKSTAFIWDTFAPTADRDVPLSFDLGIRFFIHRVRFYPREGFEGRFLERFRLNVNDGDLKNLDVLGRPMIWKTVLDRTENANVVVDVEISPQPARFVQLLVPRQNKIWEIAEWEIYGRGFVPQASYMSELIDLKDRASLGEISWSGRSDSGARVFIRTRSGMDDDPNVYWKKTGRGDERLPVSDLGEPLTRRDYEKLSQPERGPMTYDIDNWSFWSPSYDFEEGLKGVPIVSPSPRQFFQIKVDFFNTPDDGAQMDSLSFEFSQPPVAREIIAEISPGEVAPARVTTFTYALRPTFGGDDTGFDSLEITIPAKADRIGSVRVKGLDVPFTVEFLDDPPRLVVHFPRMGLGDSGSILEITFDAVVFRYGTPFDGRVFDSEADEVPQRVNPGDATDELRGDDLTVSTSLGPSLIASLRASPNPFTPNGDGINDTVSLSYALLKLTLPISVSVRIYDLSGRLVRTVYAGEDVSGGYVRVWDGLDDNNRLVPPGIYVYQVSVDADRGKESKTGTVAAVY